MIASFGVDLVSVKRIGAARARHGERFLRRVFTEAEIAECMKRAAPDEGLAARFAAKEAAMKALGTGWAKGVGWRDVEVATDASGRPELVLHGFAAEAAGPGRPLVSLSHDGGFAVAVVILEK